MEVEEHTNNTEEQNNNSNINSNSNSKLHFYKTFDDMNIDDNILRGIYAYGFETPSKIQQQAIVPLATGRDILAQAQSGTGKTATFLIGVLQRIISIGDFDNIKAVILAPTRELAIQITDVANNLSKYTKINSMCAIGGVSVYDNIRKLRENNINLLIGTPGRILHLCEKKYVHMENVRMLILDEVDEMFSIGFKEQIYNIFQYLPPSAAECQVGFFSATIQENTLLFGNKILNNPVRVFVKESEITLEGITQFYIDVRKDHWKINTLLDIYEKLTINQAIIYTNTKNKANEIQHILEENGHTVACIHSGLTQQERNDIIQKYRLGKSRILIATDMLARGIDIQQVSIVINFEIPRNKDTYIHRIGRSGRYGRKGIAINLIAEKEYTFLKEIESYYQTEITEMPIDISTYL